MGVVYRAISKTSRKSYIGVTTRSLKSRRLSHLSRARNNEISYFYNAIRKYGEKDFEWTILAKSDSLEKLFVLEQKFIVEMSTKYPNGYNISKGGARGFLGCTHSKEMRKKWASAKGKAVKCLNNNKIYPTIKSAALDTKTHRTYIAQCCNGGTEMRYPWFWDLGWRFEWANKSEVNVEPILRENRRRIK